MEEIKINNKIIYYDNFLIPAEKIADKLNELNKLCNEIEIITQFNTMDNLQQVKVLLVLKLTFKTDLCYKEFLTSKDYKNKLSIS